MLNQRFTPIQKVSLSLTILFILNPQLQLLAQGQVEPEKLFKMSLEELMNVEVVTATKFLQRIPEVPARVHVITSDQISERGYFTLEEVFSDLPGFQFRNIVGFNSYVFLRGVPNQNNLVLLLVDGVQINELNSGGFYGGGQFNLSNVERIEVVYGPASVLYGTNAISGIINIITKGPEKENSGHVSVALGSFATSNIDFGYEHFNQEKDLGFRIAGMYKKSEKADLRGKKGDNNWTDNMENFEDDLAFAGKVIYKSFSAGVIYQEKQASRTTNTRTIDDIYLDKGTLWDIQFINGFAQYVYNKNDKWSTQSKLYYRNATVKNNTIAIITKAIDDDPGDQVGYYRPNDLIGFECQLNYKMRRNLNFIAGIVLEREKLAKSFSKSHSFSQDEKPPEPSKPEQTINRLLSLYLQSQYNIIKPLSLILGIRQDSSGYYGEVFTPRAAIVFNKDKTTAKLLYNEAFRAPKPWDYYWGTGNPDLKSEKMRSGELYLSYMFSRDFNINASLYNNTLSNQLTKDEAGEKWINLGKVITNGIELSMRYSRDKITSYINYTYNNSKDQDGNPIPEIAEHSANAGFMYSFTPKLRFHLRGNYLGKRKNPKIISATGSDLVDYAIVCHLHFSYLNFHNFDFHFDVNNLFDLNYFHTSNLGPERYRQPQRTLSIRIDYNF